MEVRQLGEFGLIEMLTEMVTKGQEAATRIDSHGFKIVVDIGDDAAAWECGTGTELATTDTVVEGVHFTRQTTPWPDLGWKLMAANISDIAAMGGAPLHALVTLGLPADTLVEDMRDLYQGMLDMAKLHGVRIIGGDVVRSPVAFVTVGLSGVCQGQPMLRSAAQPGQPIGVTGYVGSSAGGLEILLKGIEASPKAAAYLTNAHRRPAPCVMQGLSLADEGVKAGMDVSDGLADDLSKLCSASGVAARLFASAVPQHPMLEETFPERSLELALGGGEDYQLLFTAPDDTMQKVMAKLGPPATIVGEIVAGEPGKVTVLDDSGEPIDALPPGWDHFR